MLKSEKNWRGTRSPIPPGGDAHVRNPGSLPSITDTVDIDANHKTQYGTKHQTLISRYANICTYIEARSATVPLSQKQSFLV